MSVARQDAKVFLHVDIDSPSTLLRFWGKDPDAGTQALDRFYEAAMSRALALFRECLVPATFFCVGQELERSKKAAELVRQAFAAGHEIANHSYSHPYGFSELSDEKMREEVVRCSEAILKVTGKSPSGFRAPSFSLNARLLDTLEALSFRYDSSAFYSLLGPAMKWYHRIFSGGAATSGYASSAWRIPARPYFPGAGDHRVPGPPRGLLEIPLPVSAFGMPFYHNFHLTAGSLYRWLDARCMRQADFPYLFHLIEFCDLSDGMPVDLAVHPNVKKSAARKIQSARNMVRILMKRYRIARSDEFAWERTRQPNAS